MTNVKNVAFIGSMAFPAQDGRTHGVVKVYSNENDGALAYAIKPSYAPTYIITPAGASRLVMGLARDLYEAGHITPGEITDHMLRDTED